ncbi:SepM family pheromone-processing serine protease [Sporolactobacillus vineae]|uniref:SepM family pheromone-processing serine protease n=1 Tax=Sporolactobacillus vineae TaxID=444463 RepID=UPI000288B496|nr:SepM family pheromone-processing serine protease [Sporolactobacillus vineae]
MNRRKRSYFKWISPIVIVLLLLLVFIRLPYFVQSPGKAQTMNGLVSVSSAHPVHGDYRLVYIYLGQANVYQYLWASLDGNPYTTLVPESEVKIPDESDAAYNLRQKNYMTQAQQAASYVAYKAAGKKPELIQDGALVLDVMSGMPAAKVLKTGDLIIGAEQHKVSSTAQLNTLIKNKKPGDRVNLTVRRGNKTENLTVTIARFPKSLAGNGKKQGIGIYQSDQMKVNVHPPVRFKITNIGGPSAGLMMTLDIYDQLTRQDLAKGRNIAGTGTIEMDGSVGPIGGIAEKIVGADQSGVSIFFAPVADNEYKTAVRTAKRIGSKMKIVPVRTFQDAVGYLSR